MDHISTSSHSGLSNDESQGTPAFSLSRRQSAQRIVEFLYLFDPHPSAYSARRTHPLLEFRLQGCLRYIPIRCRLHPSSHTLVSSIRSIIKRRSVVIEFSTMNLKTLSESVNLCKGIFRLTICSRSCLRENRNQIHLR